MTNPTCSSMGDDECMGCGIAGATCPVRQKPDLDELARQYIRTHAALDHVLRGGCFAADHPHCAVTRAVQEKFTATLKGYIP